MKRQRPDYQMALFDRYLAIATRIVATPPECTLDPETGDSPETTAWVATLTDEQALVAFANLACNEAASNAGYGKGPQVCGWCVLAAGDTQEAADAAPTMTLAEVREHTLKCQHNPLVKSVAP